MYNVGGQLQSLRESEVGGVSLVTHIFPWLPGNCLHTKRPPPLIGSMSRLTRAGAVLLLVSCRTHPSAAQAAPTQSLTRRRAVHIHVRAEGPEAHQSQEKHERYNVMHGDLAERARASGGLGRRREVAIHCPGPILRCRAVWGTALGLDGVLVLGK